MTASTVQKLPVVIDYLVTIFQAAVGTTVTVYDGPVSSSASDPAVVFVGDDDDPDSDDPIGEISQTPATIGNRQIDEATSITCCASYLEGDTAASFKPVRDGAFALVKACEDAVRNDVNLGGRVLWAKLRAGTLRQSNTKNGPLARVTFYIDYRARI